MKTDKEVQNYFFETGMFSYNGVSDDNIFGEGEEWYVLDYIPGKGIYKQPEGYSGPYKSYDEAAKHESLGDLSKRDMPIAGYIYTKWNDSERERVRKVREAKDNANSGNQGL